MAKTLRKAIRSFVYEIIVLGVIYYGLVTLNVMTKNINYVWLLVVLAVIFFGQWIYFYFQSKSN